MPDVHNTCPACGGKLVPFRAKLVCDRCRTVVETCCEGTPRDDHGAGSNVPK